MTYLTRGEVVLILRTKMSLSQEQFAKIMGVHRNAVQRWECEKTGIRFVNRIMILKIIKGISINKREKKLLINSFEKEKKE